MKSANLKMNSNALNAASILKCQVSLNMSRNIEFMKLKRKKIVNYDNS